MITNVEKDMQIIASITEEQKKEMEYGISQGYDPDNVASNDYVQKTDDCSWVF